MLIGALAIRCCGRDFQAHVRFAVRRDRRDPWKRDPQGPGIRDVKNIILDIIFGLFIRGFSALYHPTRVVCFTPTWNLAPTLLSPFFPISTDSSGRGTAIMPGVCSAALLSVLDSTATAHTQHMHSRHSTAQAHQTVLCLCCACGVCCACAVPVLCL